MWLRFSIVSLDKVGRKIWKRK